MSEPIRIQRKRTKGWKMPPNTICVTRPGKWGNPFKVMGDMVYFHAGYRRKIFSQWVLYYQDGGHKPEEAISLFNDLMMDLTSHEAEPEIISKFRLMRDTIKDLQGKNLACFCKEGEKCHADVLLKLANL